MIDSDASPQYTYVLLWQDPYTNVAVDPGCGDTVRMSLVIQAITDSPNIDEIDLYFRLDKVNDKDNVISLFIGDPTTMSCSVQMSPPSISPWTTSVTPDPDSKGVTVGITVSTALMTSQSATLVFNNQVVGPKAGEALIVVQESEKSVAQGSQEIPVLKFPRVVRVSQLYFTLANTNTIVDKFLPNQAIDVKWRSNRVAGDPGTVVLYWNAAPGKADVTQLLPTNGIVTYSKISAQYDLTFRLVDQTNDATLYDVLEGSIRSLYPVIRQLTTDQGQQPVPGSVANLIWWSSGTSCTLLNLPGSDPEIPDLPPISPAASPVASYTPPTDPMLSLTPITLKAIYKDSTGTYEGDEVKLLHRTYMPAVLHGYVCLHLTSKTITAGVVCNNFTRSYRCGGRYGGAAGLVDSSFFGEIQLQYPDQPITKPPPLVVYVFYAKDKDGNESPAFQVEVQYYQN